MFEKKKGWRRISSDCVDFLLTQSCLSQWWTWAKIEGSTSKVTSFEASDIVNSIVVDYHGDNKGLVITMMAIAMAMLMTSLVVMSMMKTVVMKMDMIAVRNDRDDSCAR